LTFTAECAGGSFAGSLNITAPITASLSGVTVGATARIPISSGATLSLANTVFASASTTIPPTYAVGNRIVLLLRVPRGCALDRFLFFFS
jgi:hypothetical protein